MRSTKKQKTPKQIARVFLEDYTRFFAVFFAAFFLGAAFFFAFFFAAIVVFVF